jgi:hypothetical protein
MHSHVSNLEAEFSMLELADQTEMLEKVRLTVTSTEISFLRSQF